jgi:hypothetical protein
VPQQPYKDVVLTPQRSRAADARAASLVRDTSSLNSMMFHQRFVGNVLLAAKAGSLTAGRARWTTSLLVPNPMILDPHEEWSYPRRHTQCCSVNWSSTTNASG